ncbi:hypothetical protein [Acinetobacter schindleri]|uniref:hypothetical protein n=1 Tax=Acinetobacter schindleri TaxID=108981 RepID=UPI0022F3F998|nr:hypothetical protein [Acinetobacter schindleri]WBX38988.1 hypothetical protein MYA84_04920 [Acinetobacter schindleri]
MNFKIDNHKVCLKYNVDGESSNQLVSSKGNLFTFQIFGSVGQNILIEGSNCPEKNVWTEILKETLTTPQSSATLMMSWSHIRVTGTASLVASRG